MTEGDGGQEADEEETVSSRDADSALIPKSLANFNLSKSIWKRRRTSAGQVENRGKNEQHFRVKTAPDEL